MNATILKRPLKKNRTSLLLDITVNGKRSQKTLRLYLFTKPKTQEEKDQNKAILKKAELIRFRTLNNLHDNAHQISTVSKSKILLLDYFNHLVASKKRGRSAMIWHSAVVILKEYLDGEPKLLREVTESDIENIKKYFLSVYVKKNDKMLSSSSAATYFSKIKAGFNLAFKEKLISSKISDNVKSLPKKTKPRQYLTIDELKKLKVTDCDNPLLKTAFLFSALTGLRWIDISKLTWGNIKYSTDRGYYITFTQQKTDSEEWLSVNDQAIDLIGQREDNDVVIFRQLSYSPHFKAIIKKWLTKAGIDRMITFHCARHSFASALVSKDVNMLTISKMLGHKDIRTTQLYSQVVDKAKIEAAKLLDIF